MSEGGGCNIFRMMFCCRNAIEDGSRENVFVPGSVVTSSHTPVGKDPSFGEIQRQTCNNCSLIVMGEAVPNAFGHCHQCGSNFDMEYGRHYFWPRWTRKSTAKPQKKECSKAADI